MKAFLNAEFLKNKPLDKKERRKELMKKIREEFHFSFEICQQLVNAFDVESNGFVIPLKVEIDLNNIDISEEIKNYLKTYHTFTVFNVEKYAGTLYIMEETSEYENPEDIFHVKEIEKIRTEILKLVPSSEKESAMKLLEEYRSLVAMASQPYA